jgi:ABC-2 type transport system permease protein
MTRLVAVELRRFTARSLVRLVVAAMVLVPLLTLLTTWQAVQPADPAEVAQAEQFYAEELESWELHGPEMVAQCEADEADERAATGEDVDFGCDQMGPPQREWYVPVVPTFAENTPLLLASMTALLLLAALLVGGTFTAAEHATGAMGTWLTFEPRRLRVYASKLLAVALGIVPPAVVMLAVLVGGTWAVHQTFDAVGDVGVAVWEGLGWTVLRLVALAVLAAVVGAALGLLLRHTAGVLGAVIAYAVLEMAAGGLLSRLVPEVQRWLLMVNVRAWASGGTTYVAEVCTTDAIGRMCESVERVLPAGAAAGYLLVVTAVLVTAGALVFRRRDVG